MVSQGGDRQIEFAVAGSPDSELVVKVPESRTAARTIKARYRDFFCAPAAGGCGEPLTFAIGEINVPHFRHKADTRCRLTASAEARDQYTHLAIQTALKQWIDAMPGYSARLEVAIERARTDVFVTGPGFRCCLEVQRSPLDPGEAEARTARYLAGAGAVDWLFEKQNNAAHREILYRRGYSFRVGYRFRDTSCRLGVSYLAWQDGARTEKVTGGPLSDWTITADGLHSKHLEVARAAYAELLRQEQALEEARRKAEEDERRARAEAQRRREEDARKAREAQSALLAAEPVHPPGAGGILDCRSVLSGSPKQIAWASTIRSSMVAQLKVHAGQPWLDFSEATKVARWMDGHTQARWWIELFSGDRDLEDLFQRYEQIYGRIEGRPVL
ncbi:competence protein CoiA family protein [Crystallibacter crystallopoietes]|uniref:competence protein CoiA family protein n=1 Tax=Crystallibacter crystallopoietes TaxID=37928 RepID=UPI0002DED16D|nr:competence protein CoiA family protein [Arthrobacter crystallopoietes]